MMQQAAEPDDYIVATGELHSIGGFLNAAFRHVGRDWNEWVEVDPSLIRPVDVGILFGDPSKAGEKLGWVREVAFKDLVWMMMNATRNDWIIRCPQLVFGQSPDHKRSDIVKIRREKN